MKKRLIKILVITIALVNIAMASVFVFHEFLDFTSSNSALYFLRGRYGGIEIRRDLLLEDAKRVIFMLDANSIFNYLVKGIAVAKHKSVLELTWDEDVGFGHVKQFRPDGTELTFPFSRFMIGERVVQGLFLGGDLSYGDMTRSDHHNTSGMGYFDGERWYHIWCRTNEGIRLRGGKLISVNTMDFLGSRVLKNTEDEVILQSDHRRRRRLLHLQGDVHQRRPETGNLRLRLGRRALGGRLRQFQGRHRLVSGRPDQDRADHTSQPLQIRGLLGLR
jgi:hypothetical protein